MAGKGSRKALKAKKGELYFERFAYDILTFTLPLCGLPKEKLKSKERNKNPYDDRNICNISELVIHVALSMRDEWKTMFESRLNSSGLDVMEKINEYLKSFIAVSREFQCGDISTKIRVSLAAYSEMILFLNYKGIEFDFDQLIISWRMHFMALTTSQKKASESLQNLFGLNSGSAKFMMWVISFLKIIAIPYGRRNDVSKVFLRRISELKQIKGKKDLELANVFAHLCPERTNATSAGDLDPVLPPGFESLAVLPGDRVSPEPPECSTKSGVGRKDKKSRRRSARPIVPPGFELPSVLPGDRESTEPPECSTKSSVHEKNKEYRRLPTKPVVTLGFEPLDVLPGDREYPEPPKGYSTKKGVDGKDKESRRQSSRLVVPPGFESLAILPGDRESTEPPGCCSIESGVSGKDKESRRLSARPVLSPSFEPLGVMPDDRESPEPPECCSTKSGVGRKHKESRRRSARSVVPPGFEPLGILPDDRESPESPEGCSLKHDVRGTDKESRRRSVRSADVRLKPSTEQGIEDSFGHMSLSSQQEKEQKNSSFLEFRSLKNP